MASPNVTLTSRSLLYKSLSVALQPPTKQFLQTARRGSLRSLFAASSTPLRAKYMAFCGALQRDAREHSLAAWEAEYHRLFTLSEASGCPVYETEYMAPHTFAKTRELADIAGFYKAFGLGLSPRFKERPDHIVAELEFMHHLTRKEAYAWEHGWREKAEICREAQTKFLRDHVAKWTPVFAQFLEAVATMNVYRAVAQLLFTFIDQESTVFGIRSGPREPMAMQLESTKALCESGE